MGIGDEIMATGLARGADAAGKRIAFGDGRRLIWGPFCEQAFRYNPNIARSLDEKNFRWIDYYKGRRWYNHAATGRWVWNYDFKAPRGEFFFDERELACAVPRDGVLLEPNVPWHKAVAPNKDWGIARWQLLADRLRYGGLRVWQFSHGKLRLAGVEEINVADFREAAAALSAIELAIVPEGGLHHAAAAVGTRAIVIFGGFIPPAVTGYPEHVNLTGDSQACGSWNKCQHCRRALDNITVDEVYGHAIKLCEQTSTARGRARAIP